MKLTFTYGAKLADPHKLFNAGLEGDKINQRVLKELIRAAPWVFAACA